MAGTAAPPGWEWFYDPTLGKQVLVPAPTHKVETRPDVTPKAQTPKAQTPKTQTPATGTQGKGEDRGAAKAADTAAKTSAAAQEAAKRAAENQAKRAAAIATARQKALAGARVKADKLAKDVEFQTAMRNDRKNRLFEDLAEAQNRHNAAIRADDAVGRTAAIHDQNRIAGEIYEIEVQNAESRGAELRGNAFEKVKGINAVRYAMNGGPSGIPLGGDTRELTGEDIRNRYGYNNPIVAQMDLIPNARHKVGEVGYGKEIRQAARVEVVFQERHPEFFDPGVLNAYSDEIIKHDEVVQERFGEVMKASVKAGKAWEQAHATAVEKIAEYKRTKSPVAYRAALAAANREERIWKQYNKAFNKPETAKWRREYITMNGRQDDLAASGKLERLGDLGVKAEFGDGIDRVIKAAEERQYALLGESKPKFYERVLGGMAMNAAAIVVSVAENTRREVTDPVYGVTRLQTTDERLNELYNVGAVGGSQEIANLAGQGSVVDFGKRALEMRNDPILKHLYPYLEKYKISDNSDFYTSAKQNILERDIISPAVQDAYEAWLDSSAYAPPAATSLAPLYDFDRYSRSPVYDIDGRTVLYDDLTWTSPDGKQYHPGDPMPEGMMEPKWGMFTEAAGDMQSGMAYDLSVQREEAVKAYEDHRRQQIEDRIRKEAGVVDPGWLGDMRNTALVGEAVTGFDVFPAVIGQIFMRDPHLVGTPDGGLKVENHAAISYNASIGSEGASNSWIYNQEGEYKPINQLFVDADNPHNDLVGSFLGMVQTYLSGDSILSVRQAKNEETGDIRTEIMFDFGSLIGASSVTVESPTGMSLFGVGEGLGGLRVGWESGPGVTAEMDAKDAAREEVGKESGPMAYFQTLSDDSGMFKSGNLAGILNFVQFGLFDPTNFIPFLSLGRRGVAGIRAAVLAGKVGSGTPLAKLVFAAHEFVHAVKQEPDLASVLASLNVTLDSFPVKMEPKDRITAMRRMLADVTNEQLKLGDKGLAAVLVKNLMEKGGFERMLVDPKQLEAWVYANLKELLLNRQFLVNTQAISAAKFLQQAALTRSGNLARKAQIERQGLARVIANALAAEAGDKAARKASKTTRRWMERQAQRELRGANSANTPPMGGPHRHQGSPLPRTNLATPAAAAAPPPAAAAAAAAPPPAAAAAAAAPPPAAAAPPPAPKTAANGMPLGGELEKAQKEGRLPIYQDMTKEEDLWYNSHPPAGAAAPPPAAAAAPAPKAHRPSTGRIDKDTVKVIGREDLPYAKRIKELSPEELEARKVRAAAMKSGDSARLKNYKRRKEQPDATALQAKVDIAETTIGNIDKKLVALAKAADDPVKSEATRARLLHQREVALKQRVDAIDRARLQRNVDLSSHLLRDPETSLYRPRLDTERVVFRRNENGMWDRWVDDTFVPRRKARTPGLNRSLRGQPVTASYRNGGVGGSRNHRVRLLEGHFTQRAYAPEHGPTLPGANTVNNIRDWLPSSDYLNPMFVTGSRVKESPRAKNLMFLIDNDPDDYVRMAAYRELVELSRREIGEALFNTGGARISQKGLMMAFSGGVEPVGLDAYLAQLNFIRIHSDTSEKVYLRTGHGDEKKFLVQDEYGNVTPYASRVKNWNDMDAAERAEFIDDRSFYASATPVGGASFYSQSRKQRTFIGKDGLEESDKVLVNMGEEIQPWLEAGASRDFYGPMRPYEAARSVIGAPPEGSKFYEVMRRVLSPRWRKRFASKNFRPFIQNVVRSVGSDFFPDLDKKIRAIDNLLDPIMRNIADAEKVGAPRATIAAFEAKAKPLFAQKDELTAEGMRRMNANEITDVRGLQFFRMQAQPLYDLFHLLAHDGRLDDLEEIHDIIIRLLASPRTEFAGMDHLLWTWLLMESRAGMSFALDGLVVETFLRPLLSDRGILDYAGLRMFTPAYSPRATIQRHADTAPSLRPLYDDSVQPDDTNTWYAEPEPYMVSKVLNDKVSIGTKKSKMMAEWWHLYRTKWLQWDGTKKRPFHVMVHAAMKLRATVLARWGDWVSDGLRDGGVFKDGRWVDQKLIDPNVLRATVLETGIHQFVGRAIREITEDIQVPEMRRATRVEMIKRSRNIPAKVKRGALSRAKTVINQKSEKASELIASPAGKRAYDAAIAEGKTVEQAQQAYVGAYDAAMEDAMKGLDEYVLAQKFMDEEGDAWDDVILEPEYVKVTETPRNVEFDEPTGKMITQTVKRQEVDTEMLRPLYEEYLRELDSLPPDGWSLHGVGDEAGWVNDETGEFASWAELRHGRWDGGYPVGGESFESFHARLVEVYNSVEYDPVTGNLKKVGMRKDGGGGHFPLYGVLNSSKHSFPYEIRTAYERAINTGRISPSSPDEAVFFFIFKRQFWNDSQDALLGHSLRFLDQMDGFGYREEAVGFLRILYAEDMTWFTRRGLELGSKGPGGATALHDLYYGKMPQRPAVAAKAPTRAEMPNRGITRIISGGQDGADRAGLDIGRELGVETGGSATKGWKTRHGPDPSLSEYGLKEVTTGRGTYRPEDYPPRTMQNVDDADATIAFLLQDSTGTGKTIGYAQTGEWKYGTGKSQLRGGHRPVLVISLDDIKMHGIGYVSAKIQRFLDELPDVKTLNIAGHGEDVVQGINLPHVVKKALRDALKTEATEMPPTTAAVRMAGRPDIGDRYLMPDGYAEPLRGYDTPMPDGAVYIGRDFRDHKDIGFGKPRKFERFAYPEIATEYEKWLRREIANKPLFAAQVKALHGKVLWCPQGSAGWCHGETLSRVAAELNGLPPLEVAHFHPGSAEELVFRATNGSPEMVNRAKLYVALGGDDMDTMLAKAQAENTPRTEAREAFDRNKREQDAVHADEQARLDRQEANKSPLTRRPDYLHVRISDIKDQFEILEQSRIEILASGRKTTLRELERNLVSLRSAVENFALTVGVRTADAAEMEEMIRFANYLFDGYLPRVKATFEKLMDERVQRIPANLAPAVRRAKIKRITDQWSGLLKFQDDFQETLGQALNAHAYDADAIRYTSTKMTDEGVEEPVRVWKEDSEGRRYSVNISGMEDVNQRAIAARSRAEASAKETAARHAAENPAPLVLPAPPPAAAAAPPPAAAAPAPAAPPPPPPAAPPPPPPAAPPPPPPAVPPPPPPAAPPPPPPPPPPRPQWQPIDYINGPGPAKALNMQALLVVNAMGKSESQWLRWRIGQGRAALRNPNLHPDMVKFLKAQEIQYRRALRHIAIQKGHGTYVPAPVSWKKAQKAAKALAKDVEGILPVRIYAYFGDTPEAIQTELARAVHVQYHSVLTSRAQGIPEAAIDRYFPRFERYDRLDELMVEEIHKVSSQRQSAVGLRRGTKNLTTRVLISQTDNSPQILAAKKVALARFAAEEGLPVMPIGMYDRIRTLLQGHTGRARRGKEILEEAAGISNDYDDFVQNFLRIRQERTDKNAVDNVAWTMLENPGFTPAEAAEHFVLSWYNDGTLKPDLLTITKGDRYILRKYFESLTGADINDVDAVKQALQANGTMPPIDTRYDFATHQEKLGAWSRRAREAAIAKGAWALDDERRWWDMHYGEQPRWVSDPRIDNGEMLHGTRETYLGVQIENGNFNDAIMLNRILGSDQHISIHDLAFGNPAKGIEAVKDPDIERLYAIQRYGDRVYDSVNDRLIAMPWLMTPEEIAHYMASRNIKEIPGLITDPHEIAMVQQAMEKLVLRYADTYINANKITAGMTIETADLHEMTFEIVQQLASTMPWKSMYKKIRGRSLLDAWSYFWTAAVISNPAFVVSNIIDGPTKTLWFRYADRFATLTDDDARAAIPTLDAIGLGQSTAYFYSSGARNALTRVFGDTKVGGSRLGKRLGVKGHSYGKMDRIAGGIDGMLFGLARSTLPRVENASKLRLARSIYTGMMKHEKLGQNLLKLGHSPEEVDLLIKLEVKRRMLKLFPTLENAGLGERMLNKFLPFISYNFKNKVLWISQVLDHPWMLYVLQEAQQAIAEHNIKEFMERHPEFESPEQCPEHLMTQIHLFDDFYLDLGNFSDAARGMGFLTTDKGKATVGEFIDYWIRPLPTQRAAWDAALYNFAGIGGRVMYEKIFVPNPTTGMMEHRGGYKEIVVAPYVPWANRSLDIWKDLLWPVDFGQTVEKQVKDGNLTIQEATRIAGDLMLFSALGEPSEYSMLTRMYFHLADTVSEQAAYDWLKTKDGQRLRDLWNQQYWEPTNTKFDPFTLPYESGKFSDPTWAPTPADLRKRWLSMQSPEVREEFFADWDAKKVMEKEWDLMLGTLDPNDAVGRERFWTMRRTQIMHWYHERPHLWYYAGMGLSPTEFNQWLGDFHRDELLAQFYSFYDWKLKPENEKEAALWEKDREAWLDANPEVKEHLASLRSDYEVARDSTIKRWDAAFKGIEIVTRMRQAAWEAHSAEGVKAAKNLDTVFGMAFEEDTIGRDNKPDMPVSTKVGLDVLRGKLAKAGNDPVAIAKAEYGQRMGGLIRSLPDKPFAFQRELLKHPDLMEMYFKNNPGKRFDFQRDVQYMKFWDRFGRLADAGRWDAAWDAFDAAPAWIRERYYANNPGKAEAYAQNSKYVAYMGEWMRRMDVSMDSGMDYYWSLPQWVRDQYIQNNPDSKLAAGRYYGHSDGGKWVDYGPPSGRPSLTDAQFNQYMSYMKTWIALSKKDDQKAKDYFRSLPKWAQDFYISGHPDQGGMMLSDGMMRILMEYFGANKANQQAMLENSPALARYLNGLDGKAGETNAILYAYSQLPDDPWLKRVYREKYPEIFSKEAKGQQYIEDTMQRLKENPEFIPGWMKWYEQIATTLQEAMKHSLAPPAEIQIERPEIRGGHARGMSAEDVRKRVKKYATRDLVLNKRMPALDPIVE